MAELTHLDWLTLALIVCHGLLILSPVIIWARIALALNLLALLALQLLIPGLTVIWLVISLLAFAFVCMRVLRHAAIQPVQAPNPQGINSIVNLPDGEYAGAVLSQLEPEKDTRLLLIRLQGVGDANRIFGADTTDLLLADVAYRLNKAAEDSEYVQPFTARHALCALNAVTYLAIVDLQAEYAQDAVFGEFNLAVPRPFAFSEFSQRFSLAMSLHAIPSSQEISQSLHSLQHFYPLPDLLDQNQLSRQQRLSLMQVFRQAVKQNALDLVVMPQLSLKSKQITAGELLLGWQHPTFGQMKNRDLITLAEQTGVIYELTFQELRTAFDLLVSIDDPEFSMAVNLSSSDLFDSDLVEFIEQQSQRTGIKQSRLTLELSCQGLINTSSQGLTVLQQLANLGCKLALDNFGQGHASLPQLHQLPFSQLKLDASLLSERGDDRGHVFVNALIELGRRLDKDVVAVGVENGPTHAYVEQQNCAAAQGYFYSKPVACESFAQWLKDRQAP